MERWTLILVLASMACLLHITHGQGTIQDVISQRPELSKLLELMGGSRLRQSPVPIFTAFGQTNVRFTFFAPSNYAIENLPQTFVNELRSTSTSGRETAANLWNYHVLQGVAETVSQLSNTRRETAATDAPKLFFRSYRVGQSTYEYVNGAKITEEGIIATNGIVHIIDTVLHPVAVKKNALALLEDYSQLTNQQKSVNIFFELLREAQYKARSPYTNLNSDSSFVTVFAPSDASIQKILTTARRQELQADTDALVELLQRHVIVESVQSGNVESGVSAVYHASLLNAAIDSSLLGSQVPAIQAMKGQIKPVRIANTLYVTNECGMVKVMDLPIPERVREEDEEEEEFERELSGLPAYSTSKFPVDANVTVNNGVIHIVDGLLGYIYNDAVEMFDDDEDISRFRDFVRMSNPFVDQLTVRGQNIIRDSDKVTIFVPINTAFQNLRQAGNIDLSQNDELRYRMLNMHIIPGVLNLVDIGNDTRRQTQQEDMGATFYVDRTGTYVEVDRVRSRILKADVCVKNGIIHYIDNLLGMPYRTILDEIDALDMLSDLENAILQTPQFIEGTRSGHIQLSVILSSTDEERTIFAPNKDAFREMRMTSIGRRYMDEIYQDKLYFLLLRHVPTGHFYIDDDLTGTLKIPSSDGLSVFKDENGDFHVEYSGAYGTVQAKIVQRNIKLLNGVMHIIDKVLFIDNTESFDTVGTGSKLKPSIFLFLFVCVFKYFL